MLTIDEDLFSYPDYTILLLPFCLFLYMYVVAMLCDSFLNPTPLLAHCNESPEMKPGQLGERDVFTVYVDKIAERKVFPTIKTLLVLSTILLHEPQCN